VAEKTSELGGYVDASDLSSTPAASAHAALLE
jgi:hypothetical protein